jgi:hypothetical protein
MSVVPMPPRGEWLADARDGHRALRVSWHQERGCAVLSTWRDGLCVGTVRLTPAEAARLVGALTDGLADAATARDVPAPARAVERA